MNTNSIYEYAKLYLSKNLSIIPLKSKAKEPLIEWKEFQNRKPTEEEIEKWFKNTNNNIAIICGTVSGNLVVIDFDNMEIHDKWYGFIDEKYPDVRDIVLRTWVVETGRGIHIYLRIKEDKDTFRNLFRTKPKFVEDIDVKGEGGYVVAPPSVHPSGKLYKFRIGPTEEGIDIAEVDVQTYNRIIQSIEELSGKKARGEEQKPKVVEDGLKVLSDDAILKLKELLKDAYRPGFRQFLILYLSGWLAQARVHPLSAIKLAKILHEATQDGDPLKMRLAAVVYTYKKAGYNIDRYAEEIERETGVKPYGLDKEIKSESIKGITGVQEILEQTLGEERALDVIRQIEEILETSSPYRDSIIELLDYEKQLYAVANLKKLIIARAVRKEEKNHPNSASYLVYKEKVVNGAPINIEVYVNPIGGITKYLVTWLTPTRPQPIIIGPAPIQDIIERLKAEGLVFHKRLVDDVISAIFEGFIRKGRAVIKTEIESPGFYWVNNKIVAIRVDTSMPNNDELRDALLLLNELAEKWFGHVKAKFSTIIKWGVVAPFNYVFKQQSRPWLKWLYLFGPSSTGKTTLGEIVLSIWGVTGGLKSGANIDTIARIGHVLSQSTFPVIINEPGNALNKEDIVEIIKGAVEGLIVRGKYLHGNYVEIPSLAPVMFTSNRVFPRDDALLRRLIVIHFTIDEKIDQRRAEEFETSIKPHLKKLNAIGKAIANLVMQDPTLLDNDWEGASKNILRKLYEIVQLGAPDWLDLKEDNEDETDIIGDIENAIRGYLKQRIIHEYTSSVEKLNPMGAVDLAKVCHIVIGNGLLPWATITLNHDGILEVVFTSKVIDELRQIIGDISLMNFAKIIGAEYKSKKINGRVYKAVVIPLDDFVSFLKGID